MPKVMLTGSSGFVGQKVAQKLRVAGFSTVRAVRSISEDSDAIVVGPIGGDTDWRAALDGCEAVVHLAARTPGRDVPDGEYAAINDLGTARLAEQAREAGVKTFIFMSSIFALVRNAHGAIVDDETQTVADLPYGRSKLAAEAHVAAFAGEATTGISLRPPLVYGATAKGNWRLLQKLAATHLPIPFGAVHNRRSVVSVDNLADAVLTALSGASPEKSGAYAVADEEAASLFQIISWLREGMNKQPRLVPLPSILLTTSLKLSGRGDIAQSLLGDLEIDASRFRRTFCWSPPETVREGVRRSGHEFAAMSIGQK